MISETDYYKYWAMTRREICALIWPIPIYIYPALSETSMTCKWGLLVHRNYWTTCCAICYFVSHGLVLSVTLLQTPKL